MNCKLTDRLLAAFIFFTRLPLWRLRQPPKECYASVVEFWPLTGWLTAGVMALTLWGGSYVLPYPVAVVAAIAARMLLTGALHEDGLADCCDGFGGGTDRNRILAIMKDSHIGTYGVIGLIVWFALCVTSLMSMPPTTAALVVLAADPFAKMVTSQLILMLPYARKEEEAKARTVYRRFGIATGLSLAVQGLAPMAAMLYLTGMDWQLIIFVPAVVFYALYMMMRSKIQGYTGDCCGATALIVELTIFIVACAI